MATIVNYSYEIGYCALALSILEGYTPEGSLDYIEEGKEPDVKFQFSFNDPEHVVDMVILRYKEGLKWTEIGDIYNLSKDNIYHKVQRLKERRDSKDMYLLYKGGMYYYEIAELYGDITKQAVWQRVKKVKDGYHADR